MPRETEEGAAGARWEELTLWTRGRAITHPRCRWEELLELRPPAELARRVRELLAGGAGWKR